MKKKLFAILLIVCVVITCAFGFVACKRVGSGDNDNYSEGLEFTLSDDSRYYIVSDIGDCTDKDIVVPAKYNGLPVTAIGDYAFKGYEFTSMTIPKSVKSIGVKALADCGSAPVYYTGNLSSWCEIKGLYWLIFPYEFIDVGRKIYINGKELKGELIIPQGVTSISDYAFSGFEELTSITIPNSVTSIGIYAFSACSELTSVTIPDSVTSIEHSVFSNCSKLKSITIPNSVTFLGAAAFYGCTELTSIKLSDKVTIIGDGMFKYCSGLTSITVPDGVTAIMQDAFSGCSSLTSITIPDSITSIGEYAFVSCIELKSIIFEGKMKQWKAIKKGESWSFITGDFSIICSDGKLDKYGNDITE